jgi:hypothetical protein
MKNFIKVVVVSVLALASLTAVAKQDYVINPLVTPPAVTAVVPADASGYWASYQVPGLKVVLASGSYYAGSYGPATCGKVLRATVSIPRTGPVNGWVHAEGIKHDSTNTGIPYGQSFNLLTKSALAGTMSVVAYDATNNYLTVQLSTPAGGPSGTFVLNRDPTTPYTALIVPNCQ